MQSLPTEIPERISTPYKLGKPVLSGSGIPDTFDSMAVDCPFVFHHQGMFHMMYVGFDGTGYQTALATSSDLIHWSHKGTILKRDESRGWDKVGAAGTWILRNSNSLYELPTLKKVDGRYWMIYHSYPGEGYEEGSAEMGLAWCEEESLMKWHRLESPVFSWKDGSDWEKGGLYKACLIEHDRKYYMFYNAKNRETGSWTEQTGVAVSEDLMTWKRHEGNPVLRVTAGGWDSIFASDPCVVYDGNQWLMFYFGFNGQHAQDGVAFSQDLLNWTKLGKPILPYGKPGELDEIHAHKPSMIYHDGILYHFYCSVGKYREGYPARSLGDEFRCISVATSKPIMNR